MPFTSDFRMQDGGRANRVGHPRAAGSSQQKQEEKQKFLVSPLVRSLKAGLCLSVMSASIIVRISLLAGSDT